MRCVLLDFDPCNRCTQRLEPLCCRLLSGGALQVLLNNDQLLREMQQGKVFRGFGEGPLNFRPTYKFDRGTDR